MTISLAKGLAFCGLCAVLAGAGTAASAQGYHHDGPYQHHARPAIARQKAKYARAVAHGNYRAAEQAHLRAEALRRRNREHRMMHEHHAYHRGY